MWACNCPVPAPAQRRAQAGSTALEFGIVLILFLSIAFGALELARAMYLYHTLQMATQRAAALAAKTDFSDAAAMSAVRQQALFRSSPGPLILGSPVTDAHIRIDYLSLSNAGAVTMSAIPAATLPACPANNRITCTRDPYDASCIRLVRARICEPAQADACNNVPYQSLFSFVSLPLSLPKATAIVPAETLGATAGALPCP